MQNKNTGESSSEKPPLSLPEGISSLNYEISPEKLSLKLPAEYSTPAEKFEAFEDISDSEVGDTTLIRARNIEREFGIRQLYLKFEGGNPTGTHKDRIAFAQCMDALRRGYQTITVATCGNYGVAIAFAASLAGLEAVIYFPKGYHSRRLGEMSRLGARIEIVDKDYEGAVAQSQEDAVKMDWYDANPGGGNTLLQIQAYGEIAFEIYDILRDAPRIIACPVSNGTVLAGIYKGFVRLYRRGKISRIPKMVTGSSLNQNPIVSSFTDGHEWCQDLDPESIRETDINEPLVNWHAFDGDYALEAIRSTDGWASQISDRKMLAFARLLKAKEGINVLPASTAGLISLIEQHKKSSLDHDRYVAILTGKRS